MWEFSYSKHLKIELKVVAVEVLAANEQGHNRPLTANLRFVSILNLTNRLGQVFLSYFQILVLSLETLE